MTNNAMESIAMNFREQLRRARAIVVKVGTRVLIQPDGTIAIDVLTGLVKSIATLRLSGRRVILVSSGAVGIGANQLKVSPGMVSICAATGQSVLTSLYQNAFGALEVAVAQILITDEDFSDVDRHQRLCSTLQHLTRLGVIPILNENHVATHSETSGFENRIFSENDMLASLIATAVKADLLVLLTDVDGVYDGHPHQQNASLIPEITGGVQDFELAEQVGGLSRGGIKAKLRAVARAVETSRLLAVIANGRTPEVLENIVRGRQIGTLIAPAEAQ
jgi:glutamate 5-kinase